LVFKNLYHVLNVADFATKQEVKLAYWELAKRYHPDVSEASTNALFLEITAAYELLSDSVEKTAYDEKLKTHLASKEKNKGHKSRADKVWIAKYKAEQRKIKNNQVEQPHLQSPSSFERHLILIVACIIIALLLMYVLLF
jgi:DnaJ-class molecular chaperone